jgi:septal ring factor EnvC (AmiA/AmiB activator)
MEEEIIDESIKEHRLKDAVRLREYYLGIVNDMQENTRDRNEAAKNLARLQHLLQAEKETEDKKESIKKEYELTEDEQNIIRDLIKYGERTNPNSEPDDTRATEDSDDDVRSGFM